jgi:chromosome segregation ATPase
MDHSAEVLPFPQPPQDRLRLALRRLDEALAEQAAAIAGFRSGLTDLRQATQGLAGQLRHYQHQLAETGDQVQHAHQQARALERTAERMAGLD